MALIGAAIGGILGYFLQNILTQVIGGYRLGQPRNRNGQFISRRDAQVRRLVSAAICGVLGLVLIPV